MERRYSQVAHIHPLNQRMRRVFSILGAQFIPDPMIHLSEGASYPTCQGEQRISWLVKVTPAYGTASAK